MARFVDLPRHEILKARLRIAGSSLADIGRELKISHATVGAASAGYTRSRRVETAIADKLGARPEDIWPERYPSAKDSEP